MAFLYGMFTGGWGMHYGVERIGATVIPAGSGNTERHLMMLEDFQTTAIVCTPSYALYLAEVGNNRFAWGVRFAADVLAGVPSIVIGMLVWVVVVVPMKTFSALAGGAALGIMMIPTVIRTTEELVRLVPVSQREAALALGATRWRTVFKVVLVAAKGGVITGVLLAIARIAGETAPLIMTTLGNSGWATRLDKPVASLPVQIYAYATGPYDDWHRQAWAAALLLVVLILALSVAARHATRGRFRAVR
jgi:phosphate transport system permease protein